MFRHSRSDESTLPQHTTLYCSSFTAHIETQETVQRCLARLPRTTSERIQHFFSQLFNIIILLCSPAVCVCSLSPQLNSLLHKKVLVVLHSEVMPHLMEPRLLLDFLIDSYDTGITYVYVHTLYHTYLHTHSASCVFKVFV